MTAPLPPEDELLTPAEFAALFKVDARTTTRWAQSGKVAFIRTLGGHRRYRRSEADRLLREGYVPATVRPLPGARKDGAA